MIFKQPVSNPDTYTELEGALVLHDSQNTQAQASSCFQAMKRQVYNCFSVPFLRSREGSAGCGMDSLTIDNKVWKWEGVFA